MLPKGNWGVLVRDFHQAHVVLHVVGLIGPHPREEADVPLVVVGYRRLAVVGHFVFTGFLAERVGRLAVFVGLLRIQRSVEALSVQNGPVAVLLAVVVRQQGNGVFRIVFVDGGVGVRTNGQRQEGGVPNHDEDHRQNALRYEGLVGFLSPLYAVYYGAYEQAKGQQRSAVFGKPNGVDRLNFQEAKYFQDERNDDGKNKGEYRHRNRIGYQEPFPGTVFIELVVHHHHHRRNDEEGQDVYAHGEANGISHQQQPTVGVGVVVHRRFPLQTGPEGQGREERAHGVYFAFNSAEPKGVGKRVGQGTHRACTKNGDGSGRGLLAQSRNQALGNGRNGPKQKQNGEAGRKRRQ